MINRRTLLKAGVSLLAAGSLPVEGALVEGSLGRSLGSTPDRPGREVVETSYDCDGIREMRTFRLSDGSNLRMGRSVNGSPWPFSVLTSNGMKPVDQLSPGDWIEGSPGFETFDFS